MKTNFNKLLLISIFSIAINLSAKVHCGEDSTFTKVISKEVSNTNGSITFNCYFKTMDSLFLKNLDSVYLPSGWSLTVNSVPDSGWYADYDSVPFSFTFNYPTGWLPYFAQEFKIFYNYKHGDQIETIQFHGYVFFTPWQTTELWDIDDYFTIGRVWKQEGPYTDTTRVFIAKNDIPVSNYSVHDSITESWEENF